MLNPAMLSDHDWLTLVQAQGEILAEIDEALPGCADLAIRDGSVVPVGGSPARARDCFMAALGEMESGFAEIDAAERHYVERMRIWIVQHRLTWSARAAGWLAGLVSPRRRAEHRERLALWHAPRVVPAEEDSAFRTARRQADARIEHAATRAAAWLVQASMALQLTDRTPSKALASAAHGFDVAVVRRAMLRHTLTVSALGSTERYAFDIAPPRRTAKRPVLAWPALLGAAALPQEVSEPVTFAASVRANGLEWGGARECILDFQGWDIRLPLSEAGAQQMRELLQRFRGYQSVRGRDDSLLLAYDVPKGVESMRLTRTPIPRVADGYNLSVRLRHAVAESKRTALATALAIARA